MTSTVVAGTVPIDLVNYMGQVITELSSDYGSLLVRFNLTGAVALVQLSGWEPSTLMDVSSRWNQTVGCVQAVFTAREELQIDASWSKPLTIHVAASVGGKAVTVFSKTIPVRAMTPVEKCGQTGGWQHCFKKSSTQGMDNCELMKRQQECSEKNCASDYPAILKILKVKCAEAKMTCCDTLPKDASNSFMLSANWPMFFLLLAGLWVY